VREHLTNLAQEIIDTDRQQRLSLLEEGRIAAHGHASSHLATGESHRHDSYRTINDSIANLKQGAGGAVNQVLTLGGRGSLGSKGSKKPGSTATAQVFPEPKLTVKDPRKLRELHKLELSLMKDNIKYFD
jgi:hypothetical protein